MPVVPAMQKPPGVHWRAWSSRAMFSSLTLQHSPTTSGARTQRLASGLVRTVEHPSNTEPISQATKVAAPEHFFEWHFNLSTVRESPEQAICLGACIRFKVDGHVIAALKAEAHRLWRIG